ncbi:MAG: Tm-1-like ATP-binding domain-containing protein [Pseudomonadota bacterium]
MQENISVALVGTLDTKGDEIAYIRGILRENGIEPVVIDVGTLNEPTLLPDIPRTEVAAAAGTSMENVKRSGDRRLAVETMIKGASVIVGRLHGAGRLSGILSIGGGTGTHIGMGIMRTLPLGVPKLMVSTVASRDMSMLVGTKDITVMHSVVDILGLNAISKRILENAAGAITGMARVSGAVGREKRTIGLTSFGFITEGAGRVKRMLEDLGYEVAAFHANGTGGMALEDLIDQGLIDGVLDLALHEFADAMYGGYCGGIGPGRLASAGKRGIPHVVVPGGLDCIVLEFNSPETMPDAVKGRKVFWYDFRSGVRTSLEDVRALARTIAPRLNASKGPTKLVIPLKGWSEADAEGGPLYDPETNRAFLGEIRAVLRHDIDVVEVDAHINDEEFARVVTSELHALMKSSGLV